MNYYQTDDNGYLVGEFPAEESPLEPGVFLIPRGGVEIAPPPAGPNEIAQWVTDRWAVVPDFRGRAYWLPSGERHEITERGIALPPEALDEPPVLPPPIPTRVTMRQARRALYDAGLLDHVNAAVAAFPGDIGDKARIDWEYAQDIKRDDPILQAMIPSLGLTEPQLDALFTAAAAL